MQLRALMGDTRVLAQARQHLHRHARQNYARAEGHRHTRVRARRRVVHRSKLAHAHKGTHAEREGAH
eukprot:6182548-Pleurochrysis_carterae.AAC.2